LLEESLVANLSLILYSAVIADISMASNGSVDTSKYIKWNAEGVEKVPPNEAEDIQAVADMINKIQMTQLSNHRHVYSG
jgi:hypothetical protein